MTASRRSNVVAKLRKACCSAVAALVDPIVFRIANAVVIKRRPNGPVVMARITLRKTDKTKLTVNSPAKPSGRF